MSALIADLLKQLASDPNRDVIPWAAPIPFFGDPTKAKIATVGINPSNREFTDSSLHELEGPERRFHSLRSLNIPDWGEASEYELEAIYESCCRYFFGNPYTAWFNRLDRIILKAGFSYYSDENHACHIDLVPFATFSKWGRLPVSVRRSILKSNANYLRKLLNTGSMRILILNGSSVVREFEKMTSCHLQSQQIDSWSLARRNGSSIPGIAFSGQLRFIGKNELSRPITVLGFNHNIQSSFGVTSEVIDRIASWVSSTSRACDEE